ncbi:inter-alpha-trypsin inhibitor heavy chain H3-like [Mercenaria mercenaria]|uniref:inter-alpha-trypsin inhibitor heavy chain H3-like n=1 Tax=Mercenaria mercenaria TaxID=6596 RepID=UPI00234F5FE7|nr:inter-alpha-trypsin inhibitor heavy chain H3-like [Mercenaria mercenaria]
MHSDNSIRLFWLLLCVFCALTDTTNKVLGPEVTIRELEITSKVAFRYADVVVRSLAVNTRSHAQEVTFEVKLPKEAFITSFLLVTNNKTIKAVIKEKDEAEKEYRKAKTAHVIAGHVTQQEVRDDVDIDVFEVVVNVAANADVEFRLEYEELLQRHAGKYSQKLFIESDHIIEKLQVRCEFKDKQKFKMLTYKTPFYTERVHVVYNKGMVTKNGYYFNEIEWKPSKREQENADKKLESPFEIEYELEVNKRGGMVLINEKGEFTHMFSAPCDESKIMMKQIVFVIDISGSMDGNPIEQVKEAMTSILSRLRTHDFFNIILFDDNTIMWKSTFQQATSLNVKAAKYFVEKSVKADGSTNINEALLLAVDMFDKELPADMNGNLGKIIVFLTDGSPTYGETDTTAIRRNIRARNYLNGQICCKSSINTIAFGRYADMDFLRVIAYEHEGILTIIKETESNVAGELVKIYKDIENPFYKNLVFTYQVNDQLLPRNNITQTQFLQYDCGNEIVVSGWTYPKVPIRPTVKADGAQNEIAFKSVPTVLILHDDSVILSRLVAYKRVKLLLKEAETTLYPARRETANKMALELSLKFGFVTPMTSLVVTDYSKSSTKDYIIARNGDSFKSAISNPVHILLCLYLYFLV